jgi:hypothetical protein
MAGESERPELEFDLSPERSSYDSRIGYVDSIWEGSALVYLFPLTRRGEDPIVLSEPLARLDEVRRFLVLPRAVVFTNPRPRIDEQGIIDLDHGLRIVDFRVPHGMTPDQFDASITQLRPTTGHEPEYGHRVELLAEEDQIALLEGIFL